MGINKTHNKGVIVDRNRVLISSINWNEYSPRNNREAGLIIENEDVGEYYTNVFLYDWYNGPLAKFGFDTGPSAYPSISGTHNGTIKPNQTITVSKLYTYPCTGTGGHTEYAKIFNKSWGIETLPWEGYKGDWHNISFNQSFTLLKGETYNYTIRTGSYPQIHHTDNLSTPTGFINCTQFTDANGKTYNDWIPAIRLYF